MSVPRNGGEQAAFAATVVDEWVRCGVLDAVVCPGSRSTPLALALAERAEIRLHVRVDERGAGFYALGTTLASGQPTVVLTTSGTAAAELHPAVIEADLSRLPLLVCTADRPPELHHVGAPQTIEQVGLFGRAVRWACDPGVPTAAGRDGWRSLAARAVAECRSGPIGPGPVHLNLAFRDPLVGTAGEIPAGADHHRSVLRVHGHEKGPTEAELTVVLSWAGRRGLVVAGAGAGPADHVLGLAERLGWPVLADPRSGCRRTHPNVVAAADALLRPPQLAGALRPEVVLVLGSPWASKVLGDHLAAAARAGADVVAVDPWWRWTDPERIVDEFHRTDPAAWLAGVLGRLGAGPLAPAPGDWLGRWQAVEAAAQRAIDATIAADLTDRDDGLSEPYLARHLVRSLGAGTTLVVSSSMPVRDVEWYGPPTAAPAAVVANRGANGIDGVCSTALGLAAVGRGPVVALVGDVAFLHDVSALVRLAGAPPAASCTLVVVDNGGGGIFSFLPQAGTVDRSRFEQLFGTPPLTQVARVANGFGLPTADVSRRADLDAALSLSVGKKPLSVVRAAVPDRAANVELHDRINEAVAKAARLALRV